MGLVVVLGLWWVWLFICELVVNSVCVLVVGYGAYDCVACSVCVGFVCVCGLVWKLRGWLIVLFITFLLVCFRAFIVVLFYVVRVFILVGLGLFWFRLSGLFGLLRGC